MISMALIPARYASTRLPAKLMLDLGGAPVIVRTYQAVLATGLFDEVYVVTDHSDIAQSIESVGGKVLISTQSYDCGSDRIAAAAASLEADIILNVQGDEPFIDRESLAALLDVFRKDTASQIDVASLMFVIDQPQDINNPNHVKVIVDQYNQALYFSRAPIPYVREADDRAVYYQHKGVYAFRKSALCAFPTLPMGPLEKAEKIEAIRFLESGRKIKMVETKISSIGIDTQQDIEKARALWALT
ncbi:MAG TPA: 3-deoxy-manno-octulosonate cytidylyltransferase [Flavobacteriaceae bacterium]|jgi:3-deoxy-manno-octulosonate cytidylyltransferase (CMP-KDO synthetase)|nr:3-deoxy-manno-octulosonate cytidylyltransferase [Flavobacteriaceae bacterium]